MNNWGTNPGNIGYGPIGKDLLALAFILRKAVAMQNIAKGKIFKPKTWISFDPSDLERADFRASNNFGLLIVENSERAIK